MNKKLKMSCCFVAAVIVMGSAFVATKSNVHAENVSGALNAEVEFEMTEEPFNMMSGVDFEPDIVDVAETEDGTIIMGEGYTNLSEEEHEKLREKMSENYEKMVEDGELEGETIGRLK